MTSVTSDIVHFPVFLLQRMPRFLICPILLFLNGVFLLCYLQFSTSQFPSALSLCYLIVLACNSFHLQLIQSFFSSFMCSFLSLPAKSFHSFPVQNPKRVKITDLANHTLLQICFFGVTTTVLSATAHVSQHQMAAYGWSFGRDPINMQFPLNMAVGVTLCDKQLVMLLMFRKL